MAISIADLKKKNAGLLEKIKEKVNNNGSGGNRDERFWEPTFDKEKGGSAIIRFLPSGDLNELPFAEVITHYFKGPTGKWYRENSRATIKQDDPVSKLNSALWNTGIDSDKKQASAQKRKKRYYSNILVIKDPSNPDNNGKVFLYEYGPAVWNKMEAVMFPQLETEEPIDVFNVFEGANFFIKIKPQTLGNNIVPNYTDSHFGAEPTEVKGDIEEIVSQCKPLAEFTAESNFKSYDELARKLIEVLGYHTGSGIPTVEGYESATPAPQTDTMEDRYKSLSKNKPSQRNDDEDEDELANMKKILHEDSAKADDEDEDDEIAKMKALLEEYDD